MHDRARIGLSGASMLARRQRLVDPMPVVAQSLTRAYAAATPDNVVGRRLAIIRPGVILCQPGTHLYREA
ncbi:MAG: hypothetical protein VXZ67_07920 [Pseudomonadota bacterium]|nr:hypothetical protein [Pseudomonadota bacterium]